MTDWNGFDKGVVGKKLPSDTTLNNMRKADLIELLHTADENHKVLAAAYRISVDNNKCNRCVLTLNNIQTYNQALDDFIAEIERQTNFYCGKDSQLRQILEQLKRQNS